MPILGRAIAKHLTQTKGLYSVELPTVLYQEILELVSACNTNAPKRALFVTDGQELSSDLVEKTSWSELLKWRTDDDRIFVWQRGTREPDTSFQSVVKPFISSRFPGEPSGQCTLNILAKLSIKEIWQRAGLEPVGSLFEIFVETASWVAGVLSNAFELVGSTANAHWSDSFLVHWSSIIDQLDENIKIFVGAGSILNGRHAWEIIRIAGLPVPSQIMHEGNPFLREPEILKESQWRSFASSWQKIIEDYIVTEGGKDILLTALDELVKGAGGITSWRGLNWDTLQQKYGTENIAAPLIGKTVFVSDTSPSLLTNEQPTYPVAPKPSWWGVNEKDIINAIDQLEKKKLFQPSPSCTIFAPLSIRASGIDTYLLQTRMGTVVSQETAKTWKSRVSIADLEVVFKENWNRVYVSLTEPQSVINGNAWIKPDSLQIKITGGHIGVTITDISALQNLQVLVKFGIIIEYQADIDSNGNLSGSWEPSRTLKLRAGVYDFVDGAWRKTAREVDASIKILIPSPFSPTALITTENGKTVISPEKSDTFLADPTLAEDWSISSTPDILLNEEGNYKVSVYDGMINPQSPAFLPPTTPYINESPINDDGLSGFPVIQVDIDEGDTLSINGPLGSRDVAVVRVKERSSSLSSGLLSAVRGLPAGRKPPSIEARSSLLGKWQDKVTEALCNIPEDIPNSLYQFVISTDETPILWSIHDGTPSPIFLFDKPQNFVLPGIANGPSSDLVRTNEWDAFSNILRQLTDSLGLKSQAEAIWLSGINPAKIPPWLVKSYVEAHKALVVAAKSISLQDTFWSSYPFSIMVVESKSGASYGQLQAVLLSPMHPARLAWAFSVAITVGKGKIKSNLIGLSEGWNIPYTGSAVNATGQKLPMVAIPIDPGAEQDFAAWSALAVLDSNGLSKLPTIGAGLPLPWAGQTGINPRVVERALKDYLAVHPYINALEVDIRSVSDAPRSKEIDTSILQCVSGITHLDGIDRLGGGIRVWDSLSRKGLPPTRDDFFTARAENDSNRPFEWRMYQASEVPAHADIAFIENSSVYLSIDIGEVNGIVGALPLRRFSPSSIDNDSNMFDQNYVTADKDDLIGLSGLLAEIENFENGLYTLKASPQAHALGVGMGSRWEVLGTFNIDPTLLSTVIANQAQARAKRLLWEWRPSWLGYGASGAEEIARRPYYVIGKVPASLLKALEQHQGISQDHAFEMLRELGRRGIGLNSLQADGGTQESAAAGFFYSTKLILPPQGSNLSANWISADGEGSICGLIPIDPIEPILEELAGRKLERRADLLLVRLTYDENLGIRICLIPIEVKHHGRQLDPETIPATSDKELKRARQQLAQTSQILEEVTNNVSSKAIQTDPLTCYARLVGIATLLDLAMSFAPHPPSAAHRAIVLRNVLDGKIAIGLGKPILLWFAPGTISISGQACLVNPHGQIFEAERELQEIFIDPSATRGLWWDTEEIKEDDRLTRKLIDQTIIDSLAVCIIQDSDSSSDIKSEIAKALQLYPIDNEVGSEADPIAETYIEDNHDVEPEQSLISDDKEDYFSTQNATDSAEANSVTSQDVQLPSITPNIFVGWNEPTSRWNIVGKLPGSGELTALDLDNPKTIGIFGYMGSGKSYLLGTLIEAALQPIHQINSLSNPLAVVIFNYRRNASDRFELTSLAQPNTDITDIQRLANEYYAAPQGIKNIHILCLPGELTPERLQEYQGLPASELYFNPNTLTADDWELLMGEPNSNAVFARTIRHVLRGLRSSGEMSLDTLENSVLDMLKGQSKAAAELRLSFVKQFISEEHAVKFEEIIQPGRAVIFDLRQPLFSRNDALSFFLICSNYISRIQGGFNKLVVFDEAHEYLSNEFGEKLDSRIRLMRHEGTSYVFATQDVGSIPLAIRRFVTTRFVFSLGTRENIQDLLNFAPEFNGYDLQGMPSGTCLVQSDHSTRGIFMRPRVVHIRPRVTQHGGASRIFSSK